MKFIRLILWLIGALVTLWAIGALAFDLPVASFRSPGAVLYLIVVLFSVSMVRGAWRSLAVVFGAFAAVLGWWLTLQPSNERTWLPDVAQTPWAEISGDRVTLHNVRNCEYRTETDFDPKWETRTVDLSRLKGLDLAINYWGSEWMAHPIASFQFEGDLPVCFSIETRKEVGESYSAIGGLYRQYELVYICADERDVLRVRTNYRKREDVYLYRTTATPAQARIRFMEYVSAMNELRAKAHWYNAVTTNCTTTIRTQRTTAPRPPWDWRLLVNGYADQLLYERGMLAGGLPFAELKQQARINDAAKEADRSPEFSRLIRLDRAGFDSR